MSTITIVGAGMMGSALSVPLCDNGHKVRIVGTPLDREIITAAIENGYHITLKRQLPAGIEYYQTENLKNALLGADVVLGGVSSFGVDWFADNVLPLIDENQKLISVTKGLLDMPDGRLVTYPDILRSRLPHGSKLSINAIGGPCTSYELADRNQCSVAFCGYDADDLRYLKSIFENSYYHVSISTDVVGVEYAVAMKNAYALGISLAIGLGEKRDGPGSPEHYNSEAGIFAQSVREISKLLKMAGGRDENIIFAAGDLYVTVFGGRTRRVGILLGRGYSIDKAKEMLNGVTLESLVIASRTARALKILIKDGKVKEEDYPLILAVDDIITNKAPVNIPWDKFTFESL